MSMKIGMRRGIGTRESMMSAGSGTYIRPGASYVYLEEDLSNGSVMDVTDRYIVTEPGRRTIRTKTLTTNGSIISAEPSLISIPRHRQEKIVTRVLPANPPVQHVREVRRVVQSPVVVPHGGYRTVIDTSRNAMHNSRAVIVQGGQQVIREVVPQRYVQKPQVVTQVVRRSVPKKKIYVTKSGDYTTTSSSSSSSDDSDEERTIISKGEVVHAIIRENWSFKKDPKEETIVTTTRTKAEKNDDASSSASSSSLESRKLKILEQVRDNGVENGQVIVNDNGTPVIVKMRGGNKKKKEKKSKKEKKKAEEADDTATPEPVTKL